MTSLISLAHAIEERVKPLALYFIRVHKCYYSLYNISKTLKDDLYADKILSREKAVLKDIIDTLAIEIVKHPVVPYLVKIKGLSLAKAAMLMSLAPARRFATVTQLWSYAGVSPKEHYQIAGSKFNWKVRYIVYLIADNLIRESKWFKQLFRTFLEEEEEKLTLPPEKRLEYFLKEVLEIEDSEVVDDIVKVFVKGGKTPEALTIAAKHARNLWGIDMHLKVCMRYVFSTPPRDREHMRIRAVRKVAKVFLMNYYEIYRRVLGLPVIKPYIYVKGKRMYYPPMDESGSEPRVLELPE